MSTSSTPLTEGLNSYIQSLFSGEDEFLRNLNSEAEAAGIPAISIAPEQTSFLQMLIKSIDAKVIVEVGSLAGYSAIAMARALPPTGKLYACEFEPLHAEFIRQKVAEAGFDSVIEVLEGAALDTLPELLKGEPVIDMVFIDADKLNYTNYFELLYPHVKPGGYIIGDNALAFGMADQAEPESEPDNVQALRAFNSFMSDHPNLQSSLVPLGDGMVIGLKVA